MKNAFTSEHYVAHKNQLIALHLNCPATIKVMSDKIWLTHSGSQTDYVLCRGTTLVVLPGVTLIEGFHDAAVVNVVQQHSRVSHFFNRLFRSANQPVCVLPSL